MNRSLAAIFILPTIAALLTTAAAAEQTVYGSRDDILPGGAGMVIHGDLLYTTVGAETHARAKRIAVVDIAQTAPQVVAAVELDNFPQDMAVAGCHLFVVDGRNLITIDISSPQQPVAVAVTPIATQPAAGPQGIVIDGQRAYLACRRAGVIEMDIARPTKPRLSRTISTPFARGVALHRNAKGKITIISADDTQGLHLIQKRKIVAHTPLAHGCAVRVRVAGDLVWVAAGSELVELFHLMPDNTLHHLCTYNHIAGGGSFGSYGYDILPLATEQRAYACAGESGLIPMIYNSNDTSTALEAIAATAIAPLVRGAILDASGRLFINAGTMDGRTMLGLFDATDFTTPAPLAPPLDLSSPQF